MVSIREMDANFQLTEEILSVESLKHTTTGEDLFPVVENCNARNALEWNKLESVLTGKI